MSYLLKKILVKTLQPIAALTNKLEACSRLWASARFNSALHGNLHPSVVVLGTPELHGTKNIVLGKNLYLYRDLYLETQEAGQIAMGDEVVLSRGVHLVAFAAITLEDGVMIGEYSSLRDANHRIISDGSMRHSGHVGQPIVVRRNAWIGRGVTILGGVTIGEGAVIGANAVVTKDIPAGAVAVGIPARVIKT
ncbi:acyltransferase [Methylovulum psychrotolerans]|uniref:acyltransferase n=1 Tax=Methylovulum psychrotolerans TaxID=1704499 RepID=UPI001BFFBA1E|nr:acyltransferase [Methylovulum psychrotolerans]MBT9098311.1 acyltransferase [Methylovulum psychrotolerans]